MPLSVKSFECSVLNSLGTARTLGQDRGSVALVTVSLASWEMIVVILYHLPEILLLLPVSLYVKDPLN